LSAKVCHKQQGKRACEKAFGEGAIYFHWIHTGGVITGASRERAKVKFRGAVATARSN
jgi:hypothetical protein